MAFAFHGTVVDCEASAPRAGGSAVLRCRCDALLVVDARGRVARLTPSIGGPDAARAALAAACAPAAPPPLRALGPTQFLLPGFVDLHLSLIHI